MTGSRRLDPVGHAHGIVFLFQAAHEKGGDPPLIFDYQETHGDSLLFVARAQPLLQSSWPGHRISQFRNASAGSRLAARRAGYAPENRPINAPSSGAAMGAAESNTGVQT